MKTEDQRCAKFADEHKAIMAALIIIARYLEAKDKGVFSAYLQDSLSHAADAGLPPPTLSVVSMLVRSLGVA